MLDKVLSLCQQGVEDTSYRGVAGLKKYTIQSLTSVVIPDGVIAYNALYGCSSIVTSVVIPSSVTSIGNGAFAYCRAVRSVTIPSNSTSIGPSIVKGCDKLSTIIAPSSSVLDKVLSLCQQGTEVTSYSDAIGLTKYTIHALSSVVIPDGVTIISNSAFESCTSLTSVVIPDSVTSIGLSLIHI